MGFCRVQMFYVSERERDLSLLCPPPFEKEGHIALHMSVRPSVGRYVGLP